MKPKRRLWLILFVIVILAAAGGYLAYSRSAAANAAAAEEQPLQTSVVRQGSITISATGAGTVVAATEIDLSFQSAGTLTELLVQVGSRVEAGDILARVDDTDAQQSLANAQLSLAQAAMQTDASSTQTGISYDDISIAQAQMSLDTAQADLDELVNWLPDEDEIAQAEAQLASAQASYNAARGQEAASSTNITIKAISVEQAERSLAQAQEAYDTAYDPARDWELNDPMRANQITNERDRATAAVQQAEEALEIARLNYNAAVSSTNISSSTNAQSSLLSAQIALELAKNGPTTDQLDAAELAVRQAELSLKQAQLNREAHALSLQQAQLNVTAAQANVDGTLLVAPVAGTVMAINGDVGENIGTSAFITLADLEQPLLEMYLDESDLTMIGLDYEVDVLFDALPEQSFIGHVIQIDPQLQTVNGVSTVRALVQLDEDSFAKPQVLPVGLNATVEVIGGRAENALLVPVEALRELSAGQYAVFVMEGDEPQLRMVEVGLMDYTYAEILSGLELGDVVTTGIVETN